MRAMKLSTLTMLLVMGLCGAVSVASAADFPDKYLKLHDKAVTDAAALKQLTAMAEKGDAQAQFCLASLYAQGLSLCAEDTLTEQKITTLSRITRPP